MRGGGRSQGRTCLSNKFPGNREINRDVVQSSLSAAIQASDQRANSMVCRQIPYATEQGSSNGYQGRFPPRTAKIRKLWPIGQSANQGISKRPFLARLFAPIADAI